MADLKDIHLTDTLIYSNKQPGLCGVYVPGFVLAASVSKAMPPEFLQPDERWCPCCLALYEALEHLPKQYSNYVATPLVDDYESEAHYYHYHEDFDAEE